MCNIVGDLAEDETEHIMEIGDVPRVCMKRKIRGMFKELLELRDFPVDVQVGAKTLLYHLG